ncbi:MAG: hypothetical protein DRN17_00320 [Thermoplasmata archaeon]|nr:MAG: hypothetical protein DRN17_00320 [Thermoplasmata archaeon]
MDVVGIASNPTTWALYFGAIVAFMLLSLWKTHFTRDTWVNFFQFMFGVGAFLAGLGFGFHAIGHGLGVGMHLDYSIETLINLIFMAFYIFMIWKLFRALQEKPAFRWVGIVVITYGLGCIINALLTGGRYLPIVGWFV